MGMSNNLRNGWKLEAQSLKLKAKNNDDAKLC
jgi:hypothetical protein